MPCPLAGDIPHPGVKPGSPALQADSLPSELPEEPPSSKPQLTNKIRDFPGGLVVGSPPANAGDTGLTLVQEDPTP